MQQRPQALPPGSTIGILGSGQLGRMLAMAAAQIGLKCHIFSDASGPAFDVAGRSTVGEYGDLSALTRFSADVDAITYEFENVPVQAAKHLARLKPVRPGPMVLEIAQDRVAEKTFIQKLGIEVAPFAQIDTAADIEGALARLGPDAILKTRRLGYDGKGQVRVQDDEEAERSFETIGRQPAVLEARLQFQFEISVLVVRGADGQTVFYDIPCNTHRDGILHQSVVPAPLSLRTIATAHDIAARIADEIGYVGVLAVEMFVMNDQADTLIVNEIAPRVHNSGHWTMDACAVSQFENHMRAVAAWPLGLTRRHSDVVMQNLIGTDADDWRRISAEPDACLHLYGKHEARAGRKMGHVNRLKTLTA